jgi:hypothetical protein
MTQKFEYSPGKSPGKSEGDSGAFHLCRKRHVFDPARLTDYTQSRRQKDFLSAAINL